LFFERGYHYGTPVPAEDRIYCALCGRYLYMDERGGPKGLRDGLPSSVRRLAQAPDVI